MKVKLCGFTEKETISSAIKAECDFLGFVFYKKSPRYISPKNAALISKDIPAKISKVAVVANSTFDELQKILEEFPVDFVQFHGDETPNFLKDFHKKFPKIKIIKAFRIAKSEDLRQIKDFENSADLFLFDTKVEGEIGGSGKKFDWKILKNFQSKKDWFLSGGLNISNLDEALKITDAKMVDVSSGIEEVRGKKSTKLIKEFMTLVANLCS